MGLILVRYGEIGIKGENRPLFVKRLRQNIKDCLKRNGLTGVVRSEGQRVYVWTEEVERAVEELSRIFGIVSLSPVQEVPPALEAIQEEALAVARKAGLDEGGTFRVKARRADKAFPYTSPEINRLVGAYVQQATGARVDLSEAADLTIGIEVRRERALVYGHVIPGPGGLPVGTQGRAVALISGGIDSPVAAWLAMKRGCGLIPLHFSHNQVETEKFLEICQILARYAYGWTFHPVVIPHAEIMEPIYEKLVQARAERWTCIFCKRAMLRKAAQIAREHKAKAVVTGDSLGQVASQTLDNLEAISWNMPILVLRPLIGMDKTEVTALARRIGTFEVSTRQARSCPYLPPDPITRANLSRFKALAEEIEEDV